MEFKNKKSGGYPKKTGGAGKSSFPKKDGKYQSGDAKPYNRENNKYNGDRKPYNREENKYSGESKPYNRENNKYGGDKKPYNRGERKYSGESKPYNRENNQYNGDRKPFNREENKYSGESKPYNRGNNQYNGEKKPFNREGRDFNDRPKQYNRGERTYGDKPRSDNFGGDKDGRFKKNSFTKKNNYTSGGDKKFNRNFNNADKKPFIKKDEFIKVNPTKIADNTPEAETRDENIVCGRNAVLELIKSGRTIDKIFIQKDGKEGSLKVIFAEAVRIGVTVVEAERTKLDELNSGSNHQGVIAFAAGKEYCTIEDILDSAKKKKETPFIIIADKIMDPHNLGAIIRSAECAGAHGLIIPKRHAVGISSTVTKSSAGAVEHLAIAKVANLTNAVEELKKRGVWIFSSYSADGNDSTGGKEIKDYANADYDLPCALILGNEGDGISPVLIDKSDFLIKIPMSGVISSLNVSCAAAVLMFKIKENRSESKRH